MPLDAICLRGLTNELREQLLGARIDKVQQPARDQIVLLLRGNLRLLINAGPNQPRVQLTRELRENPAEPPMLCMLLRKHLVGGRITEIAQSGLERIVTFTIRSVNELGESGTKKLVLEAMGRRSNLILLDEEGRILECMRRVEFETSGARALLPGLFYQLPAPLDKLSLTDDPEGAAELARRGGGVEEKVERFVLDHFLGISPLIARELSQRAFGAPDARFQDGGAAGCERLAEELGRLAEAVRGNYFTPTMLSREGKPVDFTYCPITQYGGETQQTTFATFSELLDAFYTERDRQEAAQRRGRELTRTVNSAHERVVRKLGMLEKEYAASRDRDTLRLYGDLITANLYRMERGAARLRAQNYYDENCAEIDIPLDPLLTPQQNAAKYYKRYTKAKTAEVHLREQIDKAIGERDYLESVQQEIALAQTEPEFAEIRRELQETGYIRRSREKRGKEKPVAPREFRSTSGLRILVGRSNVQNDMLTKKADKRDLWLHTQKIHGSHVILCTENGAYDDESLQEAAMLAAYYSQAQGSANVPVDYTSVKFVKKPALARPGMVVYDPYRTIYVTPDGEKAARLRKNK